MPRILLNLDVDDIERAVAFYTRALDLHVGRRFDDGFVELIGAEAPLYLLLKTAGTKPFEGAPSQHAYGRLALLHDPFGHGFCLLQFEGKGYDELASPRSPP